MALTKEQTKRKVSQALKTGHWFLRRSDNGVAYNGFKWAPVGCWTTAPDWDQSDKCGGGLHGNGPNTSPENCYWSDGGQRLEFCAYDPRYTIEISGPGGKIKARRAMILMINSLPGGLTFGGSLDLSGCDLKGITLPQSVGGDLDLSGCDLKGITLPQSVGRYLALSGCDLKGITLPQSVGMIIRKDRA